MGREIHLMRLALTMIAAAVISYCKMGRSNLEPPENSETFTASRASSWTSAVHPAGESTFHEEPDEAQRHNLTSHDVPMYDGRGHPFNPSSRARGRQLRDAQNEILSVVGVTERKHSIETSQGLNTPDSTDSEEEVTGRMMSYIAEFDHQLYSWWIRAFTDRILVFPPVMDRPFDLIMLHWTQLGWPEFLFAGLPSFLLSRMIGPDIWTQSAVYAMDRGVMASVSSRQGRKLYDRARPIVSGITYVLMNILLPPLQLHSMLQALGFRPQQSFFGIPQLHSWIPFSGTSNSRWHWEVLPFLAFQPLLSLTRTHLYQACHAAMLGPTFRPRANQSREDGFAGELINKTDQVMYRVLSRAFRFLGWAPQSSTAISHGDLVLRRTETWDMDDNEHGSRNAPQVATSMPIEAGPSPMEGIQVPVAPSAPMSPRLQRVLTTATNDHTSSTDYEQDNASDATIRVASIDSVSGAVNLEIGLPEETIIAGGVEGSLVEGPDANEIRRKSELDEYVGAHHRSRLAIEPVRLLADVTSEWLTGLLLMPVKAMVLRRLVQFVMLRPEVFGVDPTRARALPYMLGSSAYIHQLGRPSLTYFSHLGLCTFMHASLGLSFWMLDWSIIRFYGVNAFGWGTLK